MNCIKRNTMFEMSALTSVEMHPDSPATVNAILSVRYISLWFHFAHLLLTVGTQAARCHCIP